MAPVSFDQVVKRFGDVVAVSDLTLTAADGEFLVLVGPSGSGKTTALRMVCGLEGVTQGEIRIGGEIVNLLPPRRRDIAMVFQDYALYPQMSVRDNLSFGLRNRKVPKAEREAAVAEAARLLGIDQLLHRKPRELSGGQRQRVALGRALVRHPAVFLMDEPLSNLDAKLRVEMRAEIRSLQQRLATTTVYVTHDQVEAMTMGDRIAVMNDGVLEQVADPATVYARPANVFVASFIGTPAMALAPFSSANGVLRRGEISLPRTSAPQLPHEVIVGFRPEHVRPWHPDAGLAGPFRGTVELIEHLGRESFAGVRIDAEYVLTALVDTGKSPDLGESLEVGVDASAAHLFDAATGTAIR
jgi:ABC-type sugar transport system ATPase subunit